MDFPVKSPVMRSLDVLLDVALNKPLISDAITLMYVAVIVNGLPILHNMNKILLYVVSWDLCFNKAF